MQDSLQHSAEVDIYLLIDGSKLDLASCLANRCTLRNPIDLSPCSAELVIAIDGAEKRRQIYLKDGASAETADVEFEDLL